ncbi:alpha/beta fold hydrolase [Candidatus Woesearchaeota archaeon]|nr:alpha/beta fold hydrolase [Candidatus Woesearchaeota archaeon]
MIEYILAFLGFMYFYRGIKFYFITKKDYSNVEILKGAHPFFHKKGRIGVLFIHGFTSSCYDYIDLGKYLAKKNITNKAILLDGHGTSPAHLLTKNDKDWKQSVVKGVKELRKHVDKLFICGDSMGGNLALWYASKYPVDGVISIGTPIFIKREKFYKFIFPILDAFKIFQKKWYHSYNLDQDIIDKRVTYTHIPIKSAVFAAKIMKETKKILRKVTAPILIMQSTTDWGVGEGSLDYIYKKINSSLKQIVWVKDMYHVVIVDKKREVAFKHIHDFIKQISG